MKISIGSDHGGFKLKEKLKSLFKEHEIVDKGCFSEERVDYPDIALAVAESVYNKECERGILICKTGIGMSIAANKVPGIRAATCRTEEEAKLVSEHNHANILCISGSLDEKKALEIINAWLTTEYGKDRYEIRDKKTTTIEDKYMK